LALSEGILGGRGGRGGRAKQGVKIPWQRALTLTPNQAAFLATKSRANRPGAFFLNWGFLSLEFRVWKARSFGSVVYWLSGL